MSDNVVNELEKMDLNDQKAWIYLISIWNKV